ncbi:MAG: hypothetical protein U0641_19620 [Anaerolineae bacterium]
MYTKNASTFGWLRQRALALLVLLALAVVWTTILVGMRAEARSSHMTALATSGAWASASQGVVPRHLISSLASLSLDSDSDYRADRAYFRAIARDTASDYRADRAYLRTLGIEMSMAGASSSSTTPLSLPRERQPDW